MVRFSDSLAISDFWGLLDISDSQATPGSYVIAITELCKNRFDKHLSGTVWAYHSLDYLWSFLLPSTFLHGVATLFNISLNVGFGDTITYKINTSGKEMKKQLVNVEFRKSL